MNNSLTTSLMILSTSGLSVYLAGENNTGLYNLTVQRRYDISLSVNAVLNHFESSAHS
jgi:hypothetical protein